MSDDTPPKSAYDLAMERLRAQDREAGVEDPKPLSEEQKEAIAELRRKAKARLAELEILHRKDLAGVTEPEKLTAMEERYATNRRRVESSLESGIARVRRGELSDDED